MQPLQNVCCVEVIGLTINGEHRQFSEPLSMRELIDRLALSGKRFAIERNGELVPRSQLESIELADGDTLEIVVAVGGG